YWWMLQFPQPEMPMVQPEMEVEPSPEEGSPPEQEGEEGAPAEPTPMPTPSSGEGEGEWEDQPEDNLGQGSAARPVVLAAVGRVVWVRKRRGLLAAVDNLPLPNKNLRRKGGAL